MVWFDDDDATCTALLFVLLSSWMHGTTVGFVTTELS
jgi:hypothetical protein